MEIKPTERFIGFIHHLRNEGYVFGIQETLDALNSLYENSKLDEYFTFHILRSLACRDLNDWKNFEKLFIEYWHPEKKHYGRDDVIARIDPRFRRRQQGTIVGISGSSEKQHDNLKTDAGTTGSGAGRQRAITKADFRFLDNHSAMQHAEKMAESLATRLRKKITRRQINKNHGSRINIRRTLHKNIKYDGLPLKPVYSEYLREPCHIIILHDVSHSMAWNNPLLFRFARGLIRTFPSSEAFVFHTRLFCVTSLYRERSLIKMKERLEKKNHLWLGGTCIADSLNHFNEHYIRKVIKSDSIIIIISDGFDTNDPENLTKELYKMKKQAKKIIWLNPMIGRNGYQADKDFTPAAREALDLLAPANSVETLNDAIRYIGNTCL